MYTLIRQAGVRQSLFAEAPSLAVSLVAAELFYKFHSFVFECLAFLATWVAVSYLVRLLSASYSRAKTVLLAGSDSSELRQRGTA